MPWTEWMTDPFSLCYSDDNKKNTFSNSGNNRHSLKDFKETNWKMFTFERPSLPQTKTACQGVFSKIPFAM